MPAMPNNGVQADRSPRAFRGSGCVARGDRVGADSRDARSAAAGCAVTKARGVDRRKAGFPRAALV